MSFLITKKLAENIGLDGFKMYSNREYIEMLELVENPQDLDEEIYNEYVLNFKKDLEEGNSSEFYRIDQHMSGCADQGLAMRCAETLRNLGISTNEHKDGYTAVHSKTTRMAEAIGIYIPNLVRDTIKEIVIPHFYNGEFMAEKLLGEGAETFYKAYSETFPLPEFFRKELKRVWKKQPVWYWQLPDGYQVAIPSMSIPEECTVMIDGKLYYYNYATMTGKDAQYTSGKRVKGTLALCANVTHSIDGYVKREIIRRAFMTKAHAEYVLSVCENASTELNDNYKRLVDIARRTGIVSIRFIYLLEKHPVKLPEDILEQLHIAMQRLPSRPFEVLAVHDEFAAKVQYINSLRIQANEVFASLYAGCLPNYINERFGTRLKQGKFDINTWKTIRNNNHLLRV
jgi:hypothetical protein